VLRTRWLANDIDILKTLPKFPMFTKVKNYMFHMKNLITIYRLCKNIREMSNHI